MSIQIKDKDMGLVKAGRHYLSDYPHGMKNWSCLLSKAVCAEAYIPRLATWKMRLTVCIRMTVRYVRWIKLLCNNCRSESMEK